MTPVGDLTDFPMLFGRAYIGVYNSVTDFNHTMKTFKTPSEQNCTI